MRLCYGVLVLMILCKQNSAPLRVAKQKWEGRQKGTCGPGPSRDMVPSRALSRSRGLRAKARKRPLCSMGDYL